MYENVAHINLIESVVPAVKCLGKEMAIWEVWLEHQRFVQLEESWIVVDYSFRGYISIRGLGHAIRLFRVGAN